ncbi:polysaccharide deacetylase family protein [Echinicola jeungdonensis]|uniref:Polysaccharide deacetylase family protein n=1 Tax=Echinicola jeungdonensis TaxID=709343 RepID=A0ABV5J3M7_9BACT|nr:polysaccharide deacetylase family protein [Echinicola jeungdonensis]MDN3668187.1 polysaccharide deacetylase family protein [Echinicola jeungdonensis]
MVIHHVPKVVRWMYPDLIWHKSREEKQVYITFDDGPVPGVTDFVLEELGKRGMKATFFMVGDNVAKFPELAREVFHQGHQIGNHTFNHIKGTKVNLRDYWDNVGKCQEIIEQELGMKPYLFRPPYGRMRKSQRKQTKEFFDIIMWDVLSGDYDPSQPAEICLQKTLNYVRNGSIIVFHDQLKTKNIIRKVLPEFLDYLGSQGYRTGKL